LLGVLVADYSVDALFRYGVPAEVSAALRDLLSRRQGRAAGRHQHADA